MSSFTKNAASDALALKTARLIYGVHDVRVLRYDDENWTEIHRLLTWVWSEDGPAEPLPENLLLPVAGNYIVPVKRGDYLVQIMGGGYKLVDKKAFIGRVNSTMMNMVLGFTF